MAQDIDPASAEPADERITARAVAQITGLSPRRIAAAATAGHLVAYRPPPGVGGFVRYSKASALALARRMTVPATTGTTTEGDRSHA